MNDLSELAAVATVVLIGWSIGTYLFGVMEGWGWKWPFK